MGSVAPPWEALGVGVLWGAWPTARAVRAGGTWLLPLPHLPETQQGPGPQGQVWLPPQPCH